MKSYEDGFNDGTKAAAAIVSEARFGERDSDLRGIIRSIQSLPVPKFDASDSIELAAHEKCREIITTMANEYVHDHFSYDPSTNAWETRNAAVESYEEGLRAAAEAIAKLTCEKFGHDWRLWNDITRQCRRCEVQEHGEHLREILSAEKRS